MKIYLIWFFLLFLSFLSLFKMNSTVNQSELPTNPTTQTPPFAGLQQTDEYHRVLLAIYSVVLLSGVISLSLMIHAMKSSATSITSIAMLNLIFTHFIFLLTVPFRIYYYATDYWGLGYGWCKVVSMMIHTHMYMSFILYVIILITRLMTFYCKAALMGSLQKIYGILVSVVVWIILLVVVPCIIVFVYGKEEEKNSLSGDHTSTKCFKFGKHMYKKGKVFNYITSPVIIVVATVLTVLQANVLRVLYMRHRHGCTSQQEFGAQLKSLCFALIMVVCFIPYHIFRLKYVEDLSLENVNEVFLSLTTFNCLDMLTFLGNRTWYRCCMEKAY